MMSNITTIITVTHPVMMNHLMSVTDDVGLSLCLSIMFVVGLSSPGFNLHPVISVFEKGSHTSVTN